MIHTFTRHSTTGGNSTLHPASSSSLSRPMDYQLLCRCSYTIGAKYTHYGRMQCSKRTTRGYGPYLSEFVDHLDTVIFFRLTNFSKLATENGARSSHNNFPRLPGPIGSSIVSPTSVHFCTGSHCITRDLFVTFPIPSYTRH